MTEPGQAVYVVQTHSRPTPHFDLRLEVAGVLRSWAVPKGPSMDPGVRRLAVPTTDHALDYATFTTAPDAPGAVVAIWDSGTFEPLPDPAVDVARALADGHFAFRLDGRRLSGGFHLTRLRRDRGREYWILAKMRRE
jgi:DNA ligase D-like protein (predicted 3'-phosphoesterase)